MCIFVKFNLLSSELFSCNFKDRSTFFLCKSEIKTGSKETNCIFSIVSSNSELDETIKLESLFNCWFVGVSIDIRSFDFPCTRIVSFFNFKFSSGSGSQLVNAWIAKTSKDPELITSLLGNLIHLFLIREICTYNIDSIFNNAFERIKLHNSKVADFEESNCTSGVSPSSSTGMLWIIL